MFILSFFLFIFLGKGLFSLPLHNTDRITSILTHFNTFISELVFSLGERREEFRMTRELLYVPAKTKRRLRDNEHVIKLLGMIRAIPLAKKDHNRIYHIII
jgi:hypothetical protein